MAARLYLSVTHWEMTCTKERDHRGSDPCPETGRHRARASVMHSCGDPRDDANDLRQRHQVARLGISDKILALEKLHRDVGKVVLFANTEPMEL